MTTIRYGVYELDEELRSNLFATQDEAIAEWNRLCLIENELYDQRVAAGFRYPSYMTTYYEVRGHCETCQMAANRCNCPV